MTVFVSSKYSTENINKITEPKLTDLKIEPYFDIYKAYYKSRYPDREIEFNPIQSTLIVKMKFLEKIYYIHMALIQYIVLDLIYKSEQKISILYISEKSGIEVKYLQETINSLLQIKIIKRTDAKSIENLKFYMNHNFVHDNNKISISSLVTKEDLTSTNIENKKEYLHDRNTIILSNVYDYIKKNKTFTKDLLISELQYIIPFKFSQEQIDNIVKNLIDKEHITEINLQSPYNNNEQELQQIFKYVE